MFRKILSRKVLLPPLHILSFLSKQWEEPQTRPSSVLRTLFVIIFVCIFIITSCHYPQVFVIVISFISTHHQFHLNALVKILIFSFYRFIAFGEIPYHPCSSIPRSVAKLKQSLRFDRCDRGWVGAQILQMPARKYLQISTAHP